MATPPSDFESESEGWSGSAGTDAISLASLAAAVLTCPRATVISDDQQRIMYINKPALELLGCTQEEVIGSMLEELSAWEKLHAETDFVQTEQHLRDTQGRSRALVICMGRLRDEVDPEEIIALAAHDLGNTLAALLLQISLLQGDIEAHEADEVRLRMRDIHRSGERIKRLLRSLVNLAAARRRQLPLSVETHKAREILAAAVQLESRAGRDVTIDVSSPFMSVTSDRQRLLDILGGLLDGAYRISRAGSTTIARVKSSANACIFEIDVGETTIGTDEIDDLFLLRTGSGRRGGLRLVLYMASVLSALVGANVSAKRLHEHGVRLTLEVVGAVFEERVN